MLIMKPSDHIHIISAGMHIDTAYPAAIRDLQTVTRTFVFADTDLYTNSTKDDEGTKAAKTTVRDAVTGVKSISESLKIPASLVYIDPPAFASVRNALMKIHRDHPGARYSFDLSGGSKDLSMALFSISLWLEGDAYYTFIDRTGRALLEKLAVPQRTGRDVRANPNYMRILSILGHTPGKTEQLTRVLPRSYIFTQLKSFYVPVRKKGVKTAKNATGKTDLNTGKKAIIPILSQGTFTNILSAMEARDLIRQEPGPGNNRLEKFYRITPGGELALQFFETKSRKA